MVSRRFAFIAALVLPFGALTVLGVVARAHGHKETADFMIKAAGTLGTVSAVVCALFPDFLKAISDPIRITIEKAPVDNSDFDGGVWNNIPCQVYCHHLLVRNRTPHRAVMSCRVWLKSVEIREGEEWVLKSNTPVPRMMEWAPSEFSKEQRTFADWQIFDLGRTFLPQFGFEFTVNSAQGGSYPKHYAAGQTLRTTFFVTADNYVSTKTFVFEIRIPPSQGHQRRRSTRCGDQSLVRLIAPNLTSAPR